MLDRIGGFMRDVGQIVRSHHERWDGGGYPDGLAGEMIPLESRVITCCDSGNALRTNRPCRNALSHEVARAELAANAGPSSICESLPPFSGPSKPSILNRA